MTCEETIARIHARGRFSGKAGLHRIHALMRALGDPQKKLKFIHIAGTNGKGSTATMIASILQESGYRVGLYTSPYLMKFHERIAVNSELINDEDLIRLAARTDQIASDLLLPREEHIGEFEFVTAIAFQYFLEQQCDIVVLETGLGGEFDATNVIDAPEVAVITSISFDHVGVLGDTLSEIAKAKAGIIKQGSAVVTTCNQKDEVYKILQSVSSNLIISPTPILKEIGMQGETFTLENAVYAITLLGQHQVENAATAITAVKALASRGFAVHENALFNGLAKAKIMARMEIKQDNPIVMIDGGHNEDGVRATVQNLYNISACKDFKLVVGMVADKAVDICVQQFASIAKQIIAVEPKNERALPAEQLANIASKYCENVLCIPDLSIALDTLLREALPEDKIIVCGSLYLAGEAEHYFADRQNITKN